MTADNHRIQAFTLILGLFATLGGCSSSRLDDGVLQRNHNFPLLFESGVVVAPVAYGGVLEDAGQAREFFTQQMETAFFAGWPGEGFVSSGQLLHRLSEAGPDGRAALESFHTARVKNEPLDRDSCAALNRLVMHRYLLLPWASEKLESGMVDPDRSEYTDYSHADDVRRLSYERVEGRLQHDHEDRQRRARWSSICGRRRSCGRGSRPIPRIRSTAGSP